MFLSPTKSPARGATEPGSVAVGRRWLVSAALALVTCLAYAGVVHCGFVDYDDPSYILKNTSIQHGLHWSSVVWAFTTGWASNWHPLTWISHMVDFDLFGRQPLGYHMENVLWHAANAVILFWWLEYLTGAFWRSAIVAAFFALHPFHVESVAWISERKDLLSTFFWIVTAWFYVAYVRQRPGSSRRRLFYGGALFFFLVALLCKPMVVTLPCVLLLLDFWPLRRTESWGRLAWEKAPFFLLSASDSVVTVIVQKTGGAVASLAKYPMVSRVENTPIAYARYVEKIFWPSGLTMYYRHVDRWPLWIVAATTLFLVLVTLMAFRVRRVRPYLVVGWLWFLGMIFPTVGLLQVGIAAMADRYSYLSSVGIFIAVAWFVQDWLLSRPARVREAVQFVTALSLLGCGFATARQVTFWKDTGTLFHRAGDVDGGNYIAFYNVGCWLTGLHEYPQAEGFFRRCLRENPEFAYAYNDLAFLEIRNGRYADAVTNLLHALLIRPSYLDAHINLGRAYAATGETAAAITNFAEALRLDPQNPETQAHLGQLYLQERQFDAAILHLKAAAEAQPRNPTYHLDLANAWLAARQMTNAVNNYEIALQLDPNLPEACNNLALIMAASPNPALRDGQLAVSLARHALSLSRVADPALLGTFADACAEAGQFDEAVRAAQQARQLELARTNAPAAASLEAKIVLFNRHEPFRDPSLE